MPTKWQRTINRSSMHMSVSLKGCSHAYPAWRRRTSYPHRQRRRRALIDVVGRWVRLVSHRQAGRSVHYVAASRAETCSQHLFPQRHLLRDARGPCCLLRQRARAGPDPALICAFAAQKGRGAGEYRRRSVWYRQVLFREYRDSEGQLDRFASRRSAARGSAGPCGAAIAGLRRAIRVIDGSYTGHWQVRVLKTPGSSPLTTPTDASIPVRPLDFTHPASLRIWRLPG